MRIRAALNTLTGLAGTVSAQTPSFQYSIQAPTGLNPGETAVITVLCGFTPGVGAPVATALGQLPVMGLESGSFSLLGTAGSWSNAACLAPFNLIFGPSPRQTIVGSSVIGVLWFTGFVPPAIPSTMNPTPVWRGTYTMPTAAPVTLTVHPNGKHGLWAGPHPSGLAVVSNGPAAGTQVTILPAASSCVPLVAAAFAIRRRRRIDRG